MEYFQHCENQFWNDQFKILKIKGLNYHLKICKIMYSNFQFSSVAQSCPTLCYPMNCSTPGGPVHHQLPEFTQTHIYRVGDAIQPFHPLSSPSPPAPNPSQHQSLLQWVNSLHEVAKVLESPIQFPGSGRSTAEGIGYPLQNSWASLVAQPVKNLSAMRETWVRSLGWEDPLEKGKSPTPVFWPGEFHGLYSLWGHKESNTTEWLQFHFGFCYI